MLSVLSALSITVKSSQASSRLGSALPLSTILFHISSASPTLLSSASTASTLVSFQLLGFNCSLIGPVIEYRPQQEHVSILGSPSHGQGDSGQCHPTVFRQLVITVLVWYQSGTRSQRPLQKHKLRFHKKRCPTNSTIDIRSSGTRQRYPSKLDPSFLPASVPLSRLVRKRARPGCSPMLCI